MAPKDAAKGDGQHFPTHAVTGREADSPRGRIYLMRGWAEEQFELTEEATLHLDQCIVCRACEGVCPSGIRMGEMMESFRATTGRERRQPPAAARWARISSPRSSAIRPCVTTRSPSMRVSRVRRRGD